MLRYNSTLRTTVLGNRDHGGIDTLNVLRKLLERENMRSWRMWPRNFRNGRTKEQSLGTKITGQLIFKGIILENIFALSMIPLINFYWEKCIINPKNY